MRRPRFNRRPRGILLALTFFAGINLIVAVTASGIVPPSFAGNAVQPITANDLKPAGCAGLDLTAVAGSTGAVMGSAANELLLGSELLDLMDGGGGDDCLVGGPGNDALTGGLGADICIGGAGIDTFVGCETEVQ